MSTVVDRLMSSDQAAVRYKTQVKVLGADPGSREARRLEEEVAPSARVQALIDGCSGRSTYDVFHGSHWVLASPVDWSGQPRKMNEWITVDALVVPRTAGRPKG